MMLPSEERRASALKILPWRLAPAPPLLLVPVPVLVPAKVPIPVLLPVLAIALGPNPCPNLWF